MYLLGSKNEMDNIVIMKQFLSYFSMFLYMFAELCWITYLAQSKWRYRVIFALEVIITSRALAIHHITLSHQQPVMGIIEWF